MCAAATIMFPCPVNLFVLFYTYPFCHKYVNMKLVLMECQFRLDEAITYERMHSVYDSIVHTNMDSMLLVNIECIRANSIRKIFKLKCIFEYSNLWPLNLDTSTLASEMYTNYNRCECICISENPSHSHSANGREFFIIHQQN